MPMERNESCPFAVLKSRVQVHFGESDKFLLGTRWVARRRRKRLLGIPGLSDCREFS